MLPNITTGQLFEIKALINRSFEPLAILTCEYSHDTSLNGDHRLMLMREKMRESIKNLEDLNAFLRFFHQEAIRSHESRQVFYALGSRFLRSLIVTNEDYRVALNGVERRGGAITETTLVDHDFLGLIGWALGIKRLYSFIHTVEDFDTVFRNWDSSVLTALRVAAGNASEETLNEDQGFFNEAFDNLPDNDPAIDAGLTKLVNVIRTAKDLEVAFEKLYLLDHKPFLEIAGIAAKIKSLIRTKAEFFNVMNKIDADASPLFLKQLGPEKLKQLLPTLVISKSFCFTILGRTLSCLNRSQKACSHLMCTTNRISTTF